MIPLPIGQLFIKVEYECGCRDVIDPMSEAGYETTEAPGTLDYSVASGPGEE